MPESPHEEDDFACEMCERYEDCAACDGSGEDMYAGTDDGCYECGGTGQTIPDHCCDCGGSPYCQCCTQCGNYAGTCGCPVTHTRLDGTTTTL
ncbi:hypothetical protein K7472_24820 [Streptomyces sp. PTM05]|uniref:Uncharacterized protein n=1 Tax=Streptantibioticus parmotrematis TaxID=2873249 RepID=A0ABS7QXV6_9ACTN|nr:hypothetical protein [Streptantibioticus parmotrematis]MBY8888038.1 hypothetical protein [Streptantibioticus parmotrematis]